MEEEYRSNVHKGDSLRDTVFDIVMAAKKQKAVREKNLTGKKVDVYYEQYNTLHRETEKFGIECKYYDRSLTREHYREIKHDYESAKTKGELDYLIVLTVKPTATGVLESIEAERWILSKTLEEFNSVLMDFYYYLMGVSNLFENDGLSDYYVPVKTQKGEDLQQCIDQWVESDDGQPLALLAGYGMGKTSFCLNLATRYAQKKIEGEPCRIPVYLKLANIFDEQGLDGLVCKHFTSTYTVQGFSFELFMAFNRLGRFLIILDGFDEMKHAMSARAFLSNIKELNRLNKNRSKVILVGRPNAFSSEDERKSVLHGYEKYAGILSKNPEMSDYEEVELSDFDDAQLSIFVPQYLNYLTTNTQAKSYEYINDGFINERATRIMNEEHRELIRRPVHAKMLCLISVSTQDALNSFTRYQLYENFICRILEREDQREARKQILPEDRRVCLERIAWDRWTVGGGRGFTIQDVAKIFEHDGHDDSEAFSREIIIGSFIEPKGDNYFYFSHRSFQEYLASSFLLRMEWGASDVERISSSFSVGVFDFILESEISQDFIAFLFEQLCQYQSELDQDLFYYSAKNISEDNKKIIIKVAMDSPWHAILSASIFRDDRNGVEYVVKFLRSNYSSRSMAGLLYGLCMKSIFENNRTVDLLTMTVLLFLLPTINRMSIHNGSVKSVSTENDLTHFLLSTIGGWTEENSKSDIIGKKYRILPADLAVHLNQRFKIFVQTKNSEFLSPDSFISMDDYRVVATLNNPRLNDESKSELESRIRADRRSLSAFWGANLYKGNLVVSVHRQEGEKSKRRTIGMPDNLSR